VSRQTVLPAILILSLAVAWLLAGRRLTLLLDRLHTVRTASLPVDRLEYDGGGFLIGGVSLAFGGTDNLRSDLTLNSDSANRVVLVAGHGAFTLGPRTNPVDPSGRPEIHFVAETGDEISFTASQSVLPWPTPFQFKILGGASPWWKRYMYYRLNWKKPTGASLEMLWRYEQQYYSATGWTKPVTMWNSQTGLLVADIHPESKGPEGAIVQYVARTKGWNRSDYSIERRGPTADGRNDRFAVIHHVDERAPAPGAGKSVELHVDRVSRQVTEELGGQ
jgi:hypothetical protein